MSLSPGARLGPYEILSPIGAGGMGEVYRARDTRLERTVAVKVLPSHMSSSAEGRQRFEREAKTISQLSHPHICALYDVGREGETEYLVMEYLEGETLAEHLLRGPLPIEQTIRYGIEIADALDNAHRQGIVHRDLKPGNVMLTKSGVKLLDFGLAKLREAESSSFLSRLSALPTKDHPLTADGTILGTLQYMAPEQIEGKETDARADLFALGAVLYEMATGRKAFAGSSQASVIASILTSQPAPLTATVPLTPPDLDRIVRRCLAKDREDRWQSARDISLELRSIGEAATPAEAARPRGPAATRRRVLALSSSALIGALLGGLAVRGFLRPRANPAVAPVTRFELNFPATEPLEGTDVAISADGRRLAYIRSRGGTRFLYVRSLDQMQDETIAGTEGAEHPFFSPDGQWIGFSSGGKLLKVPLRGGAPIVLCDAESMAGASWGSDGWIVFAPSQTSGLFRVSSEGGTPSPLTQLDAARGERSHRFPQVLPGANAVLFGDAPDWLMDPIGVAVFSSKTGKTRVLIKQATSAVYLPDGLLVYKLGSQLLATSFDVGRLELTGAPVVVLDHIPDDERSYAVSASGSLVYLPVSGSDTPQRSLCWVDRAGKKEALGVASQPILLFPSLSPDGRRLAVTVAEGGQLQRPQVWIYDLKRGTFSPLTFEGSNHFNVWTPDGQRIITSSTRTGPANLYELRADGNGPQEPLLRRPHHEDPGSCSSDGKYVAFSEIDPVSQWDIWVLQLHEDRVPKPFLQTRFSEINPMFSPDGRWLAYTSNESGMAQVYVEPFPGPGAKVEVSTDGGREPLWSRDGRELFYWSGQKLMLVDVGTGPSFNAGRPRMLLEGPYVRSIGYGWPNYDITPDGQRFVMIQGETSPRTQMSVVTNWVEEWKGRVREKK